MEDGFRSVSGPTVDDALDRCMSTQIDIDSTNGPYGHLKRIAIVNYRAKSALPALVNHELDKEK